MVLLLFVDCAYTFGPTDTRERRQQRVAQRLALHSFAWIVCSARGTKGGESGLSSILFLSTSTLRSCRCENNSNESERGKREPQPAAVRK